MATIKSKNRRQLIPSVKQQSKERARQGERERCGHQHLFGLDVREKRRSLIGCCLDAAAAAEVVQPIALRGAEAAGQTCRNCCCRAVVVEVVEGGC